MIRFTLVDYSVIIRNLIAILNGENPLSLNSKKYIPNFQLRFQLNDLPITSDLASFRSTNPVIRIRVVIPEASCKHAYVIPKHKIELN